MEVALPVRESTLVVCTTCVSDWLPSSDVTALLMALQHAPVDQKIFRPSFFFNHWTFISCGIVW